MKTAEEILDQYFHHNNDDRSTIIKAMEAYKNQIQPIEKEQESKWEEAASEAMFEYRELKKEFSKEQVKEQLADVTNPLVREINRLKKELGFAGKLMLELEQEKNAYITQLHLEIAPLRIECVEKQDKIKDQEQEIERLKTDTSGLERLTVKYQERIKELEAQLKDREYQVDFGGNIRAIMTIKKNQIIVKQVIDGWGNEFDPQSVIIQALESSPTEPEAQKDNGEFIAMPKPEKPLEEKLNIVGYKINAIKNSRGEYVSQKTEQQNQPQPEKVDDVQWQDIMTTAAGIEPEKDSDTSTITGMIKTVIEICKEHAEDGCFDAEGAEANAIRILTRKQHE